jgi:hypothetical protein
LGGPGEDALGAGVQNASNARRQRRIQDVYCADKIYLTKVAAFVCPEIGIGRQMTNRFATADASGNLGSISNVGENQVDLRQGQMLDAGSGPFQDAYRAAFGYQVAHEVAANEPCPSGNERVTH